MMAPDDDAGIPRHVGTVMEFAAGPRSRVRRRAALVDWPSMQEYRLVKRKYEKAERYGFISHTLCEHVSLVCLSPPFLDADRSDIPTATLVQQIGRRMRLAQAQRR